MFDDVLRELRRLERGVNRWCQVYMGGLGLHILQIMLPDPIPLRSLFTTQLPPEDSVFLLRYILQCQLTRLWVKRRTHYERTDRSQRSGSNLQSSVKRVDK